MVRLTLCLTLCLWLSSTVRVWLTLFSRGHLHVELPVDL